MNNLTMEIIYSEQFKRANIRFNGKPAEEIREELKKEGWFYSRNHNVWYPKKEAVENSQSFVLQIKEKYFPENQEVKIITEASEKDELVSMIQNDSSLNDILSKVIDMYGEDAVHEAFAQVKEEIESKEMNAELPRLDAEVEDMERENDIREMDDGMTDSIQDYHSELVNLGYKIINWEDGSGHILDSNGKEIVAWDKSTSEYQWAGKSWTYAEFDWPDFEKEIYLNFKEIRTAQGKFGDIVRGTFLALSDEEKENGTTVEQKNTRYEKWFRPMVDEIMAEIGNGNKEVMAIVQNFDLNHESHVQGNKWYSPDEAYTYDVQYKLLPKMYEKVQDRIKKEYEEKKIPYVVMYSSESPKFPSENKVYTVKEFNEILLQADSEFHNRKKYAEEKYGSADNYWDLERDDKLPEEDKGIQFGYDKTNFKFFNIPNPNNPEDTFSYEPSRYDIGDGNGSVFDYVRSTCSHDEFIEALNALETQLYFPEVTDSQRQFVEKTVEEATQNLKATLKEKMEDLDKAQNEYKELHKKWLIEATEADRVDEMLKNALDGIKETYDSSMNDVFTKVLNEYPFASGDVAGSEFLKYTANEVKKMVISELYLPSRNAQKSMNAEDYKTYNSIDWEKLRRIWEKFPANVNMTAYAEKLLQDKCAEKGMSVPELKTYHTLKKEDVENLQVISDEEFSDIVDSIILNDYKNIPNAVRLPNIKEELSEKLGLEKDSAFILKKSATHIRPDRKGGYGQAFDTEEYRMIPSVIRNADFAVVDNTFKNFQLIFDDKDDETKINKIIFNKDELGNYLVTIGKVDRESAFSEERNTVVAVGVAPTIQTLRERASSTALRASTTTVESNISLSEEKSTEFNRPAEPLKVYTFSPFGYEGTIVQVETDLRRGIPSHDIVGIADISAKETRERIRAAFGNSGLEMPAERMLQSLIPTDLRKDSPMDLAMAVGILNEQNHWTGEPVLVLGELELSGRIHPVRGAVAAVNSAKAAGITNIVCDPTTAELLKDIDGIKILSAEDLKDVHEKLQQPNSFSKTNVTISKTSSVEFNNNEWIEEALNNLNMDGHFETIRAIEIAVAGKHNILATGAPGSGKTRLTQTLIPALTPKMTEEESKQITRINSLAGLDLPKRDKLVPPFRMLHQTATIEEICGGGPNCRPGEMSLAHRGTLFMDETAEFRSSVIQMLRVPLENRQITLSRAGRSTSYPADFQLAMAMNPCPCGNFHSSDKICHCSAHSVEQYWKKISDPLLDRVEIKTFVQKDEKDTRKISVEQMKAAITRAYEIQRKRGVYNSHLSPAQIEQFCTLDKQGIDFVDTVTSSEGISPRKKANLLKTALTIANMDGREQILLQDLQEAHELTNEVFAEQKYKITQEQIDKSYSNEVHEEISVFNKENLKTMENQFNDPGVNAEVISAAEQKRKRILESILNGERTEMYKSFKNFEDKGVFEIKGAQLKVSKNGGLTPTGWKQLQAAMEIYRSKEFETFRYILIDDKTGEIKEQLAITSHMPNFCNVSKPNNETLKQVISRAEELNCKIAVCHNHPSGNTTESSFDRELTDSLDRSLRRNDGTNKFLGHIILDHDTFNLALPSEGRPGNCHWKKIESLQANEADRFVEEQNQDMKFMDSYVDGTHALKEVARQINDTDNWNDDFIPVVFTNADRSITGVQYYSKNFFENDSDKIRTEFQTVAKDAGAIGAFPVITDYLWDKLGKSAADYEAVMKSHVMNDAFTDVAFNHTTMTEKYGIEAGKNYYSFYRDQSDRQIDVDATWTPKVNTRLFPSETVKTKHKNRDAVYER